MNPPKIGAIGPSGHNISEIADQASYGANIRSDALEKMEQLKSSDGLHILRAAPRSDAFQGDGTRTRVRRDMAISSNSQVKIAENQAGVGNRGYLTEHTEEQELMMPPQRLHTQGSGLYEERFLPFGSQEHIDP